MYNYYAVDDNRDNYIYPEISTSSGEITFRIRNVKSIY